MGSVPTDNYDGEKASDVKDYANLSGLDDSKDKLRTSFQKNTIIAKNRIIGGPTPPDYSGMTEKEWRNYSPPLFDR